MTDLFYGYELTDRKGKVADVSALLQRHYARFGTPPSILVNKVDTESIPKDLGAMADQYVLPGYIFMEISEVE